MTLTAVISYFSKMFLFTGSILFICEGVHHGNPILGFVGGGVAAIYVAVSSKMR